jgi:hypothetical protein
MTMKAHKTAHTGAKLEGGGGYEWCDTSSPETFFDPFFNVRKNLGKIVARNKNLLQGIIGFGKAILADTPRRIKRG